MPNINTSRLAVWQWVLISILLVVCINYITAVVVDKVKTPIPALTTEGFVSPNASEESKYEWLNNNTLYDQFYASIYDQLVETSNRTQIEVALLLNRWKFENKKISDLRIVDLGSGTGCTTLAFAKAGVGKSVGIDQSKAMLEFAKTTNLPASVLTDEEKAHVEFRERDLTDPSAAQPAEFDCACALYFTIYYLRDIDGFFRNCALWVRPGGCLAVQVVNKYKFDPILDSASPFSFSIQKYVKDRHTKSAVKFDKFDYEGIFDLDQEDENHAEFRETFRFKDGSIRRQRHTLNMPDISLIVKKAKAAGWFYEGYIDQVKQGFAYSYLLLFKH
jgi:SAM-dependent methyltransferase